MTIVLDVSRSSHAARIALSNRPSAATTRSSPESSVTRSTASDTRRRPRAGAYASSGRTRTAAVVSISFVTTQPGARFQQGDFVPAVRPVLAFLPMLDERGARPDRAGGADGDRLYTYVPVLVGRRAGREARGVRVGLRRAPATCSPAYEQGEDTSHGDSSAAFMAMFARACGRRAPVSRDWWTQGRRSQGDLSGPQ